MKIIVQVKMMKKKNPKTIIKIQKYLMRNKFFLLQSMKNNFNLSKIK